MPNWVIGLFAIGIFILLVIVEAIAGVEHPFKRSFFNMLLGIISLISVNICSVFTGVSIPISLLSLSVSALAGIPGVTTMVIMNII